MKDVSRTGLVHDAALLEHRQDDRSGKHIECPERITAITQGLESRGLTRRCCTVKSRMADPEELAVVHTAEHVRQMERVPELASQDDIDAVAEEYESVYLNRRSFACASLAVGSVVELVKEVLMRARACVCVRVRSRYVRLSDNGTRTCLCACVYTLPYTRLYTRVWTRV